MTYRSQRDSVEQPFIVHQAVLGSLERWVGILLENSGGALPLWVTPIQAIVLTVSEKAQGWAHQVTDELKARNIRTNLDTSAQTLAYKLRLSSKQKVPFVPIVGEQEASHKTVALRQLGSRQQQSLPLAAETNNGLTVVMTGWPHREFQTFRADIEGNFWKSVALVPELADRLRSGTREERFVGTADTANFFRRSYGPGWALVGITKTRLPPKGYRIASAMPSY